MRKFFLVLSVLVLLVLLSAGILNRVGDAEDSNVKEQSSAYITYVL